MVSIIVLANQMGLRYVDPHHFERLSSDGEPVGEDYDQNPVIAQIAQAVFNDFSPAFYFVVTVTGVILVLAANTAFNGFPVLGSILAKDGFAPRALGPARRPARLQQRHRVPGGDGDRPDPRLRRAGDPADPALHRGRLRLVQPQPARDDPALDPAPARPSRTRPSGGRMQRSRVINAIGLTFTAVVLVIVLITKFLAGAWIAILAMVFFFLVMRGIRRHYDSVAEELAADDEDKVHADPRARHRPGLQAAQADAAGARLRQGHPPQRPRGRLRLDRAPRRPAGCSRSGTSATSTCRSRSCTRRTARSSGRSSTTPPRSGPPTRAASSPSTSPSTSSAAGGSSSCTTRPRSGSRAGCCSRPGVMVTSVPYQLRSSEIARERELREDRRVRPGDLRRGNVDDRGNDRQVPLTLGRVTRRHTGNGPAAGPGWGSGTTPRSGRSRTAATAWSGCPRPSRGWSSCGTRSRVSG